MVFFLLTFSAYIFHRIVLEILFEELPQVEWPRIPARRKIKGADS